MFVVAAVIAAGCRASAPAPAETQLPSERARGRLDAVATFREAIPAGVAVAEGRTFVAFPRWDDRPFTLAELEEGRPVAYPSESIQTFTSDRASRRLGSVEALATVDGTLWALDTGRPDFDPVVDGAAKLMQIDLATDEVVQTIELPDHVVRKWSYFGGLAVAPELGREGMAFLTDASEVKLNSLVVVDLATGEAWRRLDLHPSTRATPRFVPVVEGRPVYFDLEGREPSYLTLGVHGITLSADGQRLFYTPLAGRRLYSVAVRALVDRARSDRQVAETIRRYGDLGFAADGLATDPNGGVYLANYEDGVVVRFVPGQGLRTVLRDPRLLWPDALAVRGDEIYVTVSQRHRQHVFNNGRDLAESPYVLYRGQAAEREPSSASR